MSELFSYADVTSVLLESTLRRPSLRGGDISAEAQSLTRAARSEYTDRGFGFWDFLLFSAVESSASTRIAMWKRAIKHEEQIDDREEIETAAFVRQLSNATFCNLDSRRIVSLTSQVRVDGKDTELHLPMLDFALSASSHNDTVAIEMLDELSLSGNLYRSGRSYHYFGATPVPTTVLTSILARAQLLGPLVDHRWISHQLINNRCALRVSTDTTRHTQAHVLVATTLDAVN
ncbi:primase 1D-like protein [Nocardia xishanensis]|uniref:primase 1D-like protein n=1 Tax=Nocardia xishanensis TaxID=238964 RepID=UPI00083686A6|nr:hypothetical protein [Nocardia xishanensis]